MRISRDESERGRSTMKTIAMKICIASSVDAAEYRGYFEFVNNANNRFRTMTVPYRGGLEFTVRI
jgi:hypothetical protein